MARWTATELVADVERRVGNGDLASGEKLPSSRQLAADLGIAPNTVAAAYRRLRERGVVLGRGRQGTVVAARTTVIAAPARQLAPDLFDTASGNPDVSLLPAMSASAIASASCRPTRYGDAMVTPELERSGLAWLANDGLEADRLAVASGAMDAIERVLGAHFSVGDRIAVEDPGHMPVHQMVAALGLVAVPMRIDEFGVVPNELANALELGVSAVVVTPRAHNPTGCCWSAERSDELQDVLDAYPDVLVIEDDHAGPVAGVGLHALSHDRRRWCLVRSVAKSLGPDHRIALVIGDKDTLDRVEGRMQMGASWVSHFLQRIVADLLDDPDVAIQIDVAADTYRRRRCRLLEGLAGRGVPAWAASGFQVWIPVDDELSVEQAVAEKGYAIRCGSTYRIASPGAVRVTVAALSDEQIDELASVIPAAIAASLSPGVVSRSVV